MNSYNHTPIISIIIPIYNSESYLRKCLDSILSQTHKDFEVILVNDGSTDQSDNLCKKYSATDSRIRYYKKENGGVSSARNVGLKNAKGRWCTFVDSDDMLYPDAISSILEKAFNDDIDFCIAGYDYCNEQGLLTFSTSKYRCSDLILSKDNAVRQMYESIYWQWFICSKIFKIEILHQYGIEFNSNLPFGEDRLFIMRYLRAIRGKISISAYPIYKYRIHEKSVEGKAYSCFDAKIKTGLEASILMHDEICKMHTTFYNKYLSLVDVAFSYRTVKNEVKRLNVHDTKFEESLDQMLKKILPKYMYHLIVFIRRFQIKLITSKDGLIKLINKLWKTKKTVCLV